MAASSDLDTGVVGDKIVRTADGAYISSAGAAPVLLPTTDRAWNLPVGTRIRVTSVSPTQYFQCDLREPPPTDLASKQNWSIITTLAVTTPISTFLAGLDTFGDLARGAPTT